MAFGKKLIPRPDEQLAARPVNRGVTERLVIAPDYEIKESDDAFGLEILLPGVRRDDLNLSVEGRELVLTAARSWKKPDDWTPVWSETADVDYRLHLSLPEGLETEKVHAQLKDGVLRLTLPKGKQAQRRKIKIE